ncbi:hypothetical protein CUJ83_04865 [Methanocella sp. CWC-04]|uniref:Uncharacterized protein n=1 Tax=Methanooceanicella nereidis TaxID=2052831 RepID=A0AAP2W6J0_9EURY|nr:hypothetical protein [Methanocella sp. CWC-04]MCD1294329.1 hypothetical protein [Methanocella sp. CWC-04]
MGDGIKRVIMQVNDPGKVSPKKPPEKKDEPSSKISVKVDMGDLDRTEEAMAMVLREYRQRPGPDSSPFSESWEPDKSIDIKNSNNGKTIEYSAEIPSHREAGIKPSRSNVLKSLNSLEKDPALHATEEQALMTYIYRDGESTLNKEDFEKVFGAGNDKYKKFEEFETDLKTRKIRPGCNEIIVSMDSDGKILKCIMDGFEVPFKNQ